LCHGVTDSAIRKAVEAGARTYHDLSFMTGCGTQCGSCSSQAGDLLEQYLDSMRPEHNPPQLRVIRSA